MYKNLTIIDTLCHYFNVPLIRKDESQRFIVFLWLFAV